jgi:Tfp pilus assembly protein PilN
MSLLFGLVLTQENIVKQINLLPWREHKNKLKIRQFVILWFGVSCSCFVLLFITSIVIMQQIKHYQLSSNRILLKLKTISPIVQKIKKLHYEEQELKKIIKITHRNRQQLRKILDFMTHLKYLLSPDIFIRLIEFYPPYFILIMHASSEKQYLKTIKALQIKYSSKLKDFIINKSKDLTLDFIIKMTF